MRNQHVVFETENITRGDEPSNILIRCIFILSAYLGSKFYVEYKYQMNDWEGITATGLSRKNKQVSNEADSLEKLSLHKLDSFITL